ncbi:3-hydroxyacyl-CoA dehydrogenase family protein [Arthrobacter sp. Y81]|uniref:3-hydroxyacyl-CoA dehydrogenase family protein n=1 Tax=Arthrobacter sp. Y81 TaxID=2058897 RepID=UPI000CE4EC55|nr:3-hydroxyacyl-CoA dehydrogenase family protein [Arthrobacter sp. Y81]
MVPDTVVETSQTAIQPASAYAAALLDAERRRPAGARGVDPRPVRSVGVIGAGLMASQLALVFAKQLGVPVLITDLSQAKVDGALGWIAAHLEKLVNRGQLSETAARDLGNLVRGTVDKREYRDCDVVIEAVFEELAVKRAVFAEIEPLLRTDALLLTNTSSLSVTAMGHGLAHPERLMGLHFFNPVAVLPLVEIISTENNDDVTVATACSLARLLGKTAVLVTDTPGFVVNRILTRLFCELLQVIDDGTDIELADHALDPLGLPMTPLTLLGFIGPAVQLHICETMHAAYPDRFYVSTSLTAIADARLRGYLAKSGTVLPEAAALLPAADAGASVPAPDAGAIRAGILDALAEEVGLMLAEKVVAGPAEVDLCMMLGANFPQHQGGLTPLLDQSGASRRVWGRDFHPGSGFAA